MVDPVITADGYSYEREAIEQHLKTQNTSPKTGAPLPNTNLIPNNDKKTDILEFLSVKKYMQIIQFFLGQSHLV